MGMEDINHTVFVCGLDLKKLLKKKKGNRNTYVVFV